MTTEITLDQLTGVHKDWRSMAGAAISVGWVIKRAGNGRCSLWAPDGHTYIPLPGNQRAPSRHELSAARSKLRKGSPAQVMKVVEALPDNLLDADPDEVEGAMAAMRVAKEAAEEERDDAEQERADKRATRAQNKAKVTPFEVSRKPWLAHGTVGKGKRPGRRYESKAVLEVKMSDGGTHWACPSCDYTHAENPRSVSRHFAASHTRNKGLQPQNPRKFLDPDYTEPVLPRDSHARIKRLADELAEALGEVGHWAQYDSPHQLAEELATKIISSRQEHEAEPTEWMPLTPEQTLDKIRTLVDDGSYVRQREELDGLVTQVADLTHEVGRLRDERKTLAAMLGEGL